MSVAPEAPAAALVARGRATTVSLTRRTPLALDCRGTVFLVAAGVLDVFCSPGADERPVAVASVEPGGALFGAEEAAGFTARARAGAEVVETTVEELRAVVGDDAAGELVANWVRSLGVEPDSALDPLDELTRAAREARAAIRDASERDRARRQRRDVLLARRLRDALARAARVLDAGDVEHGPADDYDPLFSACRLIGNLEGFAVSRPPSEAGAASALEHIANASGFRTRSVTLRPGWAREVDGLLLGFLAPEEGDGEPEPIVVRASAREPAVALQPEGGAERPLTGELAARLDPTAYQLYRPLPRDGRLTGFRLLRFALRGSRRDFAAVAAMGAAAGLLAMLTPILTKVAFGSAIPAGDEGTLGVMACGLALAAMAAWVFGTVQGIAVVRISNRMERNLQPALWDWVVSLPTQFFRDYTAGDLANRALGVDRIREVLTTTVVSAVLSLLFSGFSVVVMFHYSVQLTALALGLLAVGVLATLGNARLQVRHLSRSTELTNRSEGFLVQTLQGVAKLRVAGAETRAFSLLVDMTTERERLTYRQQHLASVLSAGTTSFYALVYAAIFLAVSSAGWVDISAPTFLAFNAAYGIVVAAALQVSAQVVAAAPVGPLYRAIVPLLEARPEVAGAGKAPPPLSGRIDVRGLTFRYGEDEPLVLDDVSFSVGAGEFVAIVGPSGSGKSTLIRLLLGFEEPLRGHVFYDDHDLATLDARAVRRQMGVVLQQSRLLSGSIFENIVGALDLTLDDAWAAAEQAGVAADIRAMPMEMHTIVTAGGGTLSGGQAQRIVIARALAADPRVLLLDEATSALDNETQRHVTESLAGLRTSRIVVAHRLTTVRDADRILVVERGRLVEQGTYHELMEADGLFARLARRQLT